MRFVLEQADPRTLAGLYKYGPATIWVSGPSGGTWWATVKFRSQEKDLDARSYEGVMNAAIRWIDEAPELSRSKRDPKRPGFYVQAPLGPYHQDITSQARWALGLGRETKYPNNLETLHATLPSGMKVRLLRKPSPRPLGKHRSGQAAHRTTDRLQAYCEYCGKWFGTGNIDQHQIVHGVGSERELQRYEHLKSKGYPASLKRHRERAPVSRRDASQGKLRRELGVIGNAVWHMPKSAGPWVIYWNGPGARLLFGSNKPGTTLDPIEYPGADGNYRTLKEATAAVARFWKKQ